MDRRKALKITGAGGLGAILAAGEMSLGLYLRPLV